MKGEHKMHIEHITFTDYFGKERTEDHYFNLNKAETIEWLTTNGDYTLDKMLKKLVEKSRGKDVLGIFRDLIYRAYGEVSEDGRRFIKSKEVKDNFMETEAYSELFTRLVTNGKEASDFINKILPNDMVEEIAKIIQENPGGIPDELKEYAQSAVEVVTAPPVAPMIRPL